MNVIHYIGLDVHTDSVGDPFCSARYRGKNHEREMWHYR
jgi:hypothetical protein